MRVTVLGCGSSGGVPLLSANGWGACDPDNPRNRRRRVSILVEQGGTTLLVDTSPDLRQQLWDLQCFHLDAVLYTHDHADHSHGIDDLRPLNFVRKGPIPAYGTAETLDNLNRRFGYIFRGFDAKIFRPSLEPRVFDFGGPFEVGRIEVTPFEQDHGFSMTAGFRFGPLAYSTDVKALSEAAFAALDGVEVWIVDALHVRPHKTHSHLEQTLEWIARVQPRRAILTHMSHWMDYDTLVRTLPSRVEPGYDGMVIDL